MEDNLEKALENIKSTYPDRVATREQITTRLADSKVRANWPNAQEQFYDFTRSLREYLLNQRREGVEISDFIREGFKIIQEPQMMGMKRHQTEGLRPLIGYLEGDKLILSSLTTYLFFEKGYFTERHARIHYPTEIEF
jgi:hypothetical protein